MTQFDITYTDFKREDTTNDITIKLYDDNKRPIIPNPSHTWNAKVAKGDKYVGEYPVAIFGNTIKLSSSNLTRLPDGIYALELWETYDGSTAIYPSTGTMEFRVHENIDDTLGTIDPTTDINAIIEDLHKAGQNIKVVATNTLPAGSKASVTQSITDGKNQLTFNIPQGHKGEKGDPGVPGMPGKDGLTPSIDSKTKHWMIGDSDTGIVVEGQNTQNFWATYHFAVSKLLDITKRNLITYDNLAVNTYLNSDTGDYLSNMSGYDATDYIAVKANTAYHLHPGWLQPDKAPDNSSHIVTFYNQNFEYMNKYYTDTLNFTTPQDACYLRVAFPTKEVGTLSLQMGTQYDWEKNPPKLQIKPEAIGNIESSTNNLIDVTMPFSLNYGLDDAGNYVEKNGFSTYDFINLKGAKRLSFSTSPARIAFFDQNYTFLSAIDYPDNGVEVPLNAVYMRVQCHNEQMEQQTDNGNFLQISPTAFLNEPSNGREVLKNVLVEDYHQPKFHLLDALNQWLLGRKFPIGFLGDSTTEGDNTSAWTDDNQHIKQDQAAGGIGKVNYVNPTSYSYLTQQLLRQRTGNDAPEIYNMGWSGTSMFWMIQHFDEVFNNAYSGVRMIGIEYGINDRNDYGNRDVLAQTYRYDLIRLVQMLYDRGIQPFIITSQAIWNHQNDGSRDVLNTLTLTTLINRIKKEVAREYHLELIDMQEVGNLIAKYSSAGWNSFNNGTLHLKDLGHRAEACYIYGKITDELETVESGSILSYLSQRVLSDVYYGDNLQTADNDFKYTVNLNTSGKQLLQQFSVMNSHPQALQLIACCSTPDGQTVEVDGTTYQITSAEQDIIKLEPGPHIIRAFNDATKTTTNWLGFKLK